MTSTVRSRRVMWALIVAVLALTAASVVLLGSTVDLRYSRDVNRMVFNDNVALLDRIRARVGETTDSLNVLRAKTINTAAAGRPYIVVSIADHRLWYKKENEVLFTAPVATGSGKTLVGSGPGAHWHFDTPRGRLVVQDKDQDPTWVPPDWYYLEQARQRGLGLLHVGRDNAVSLSDGSVLTVQGSDVVRRYPDGRSRELGTVQEGKEYTVDGKLVVPPYGTNQRRYRGVLGTRRLDLGDGYGIHGTDNEASIGHSVSHGCIRLRNADIEQLYPIVQVGTPVYVY